MKNTPKINELVVMRHAADATMYRVKEVEGLRVGLIDAEIEDEHPKQSVGWVDRSVLLYPTNGQLEAFRTK